MFLFCLFSVFITIHYSLLVLTAVSFIREIFDVGAIIAVEIPVTFPRFVYAKTSFTPKLVSLKWNNQIDHVGQWPNGHIGLENRSIIITARISYKRV